MKKVLVLGAGGFIGAHLVNRLKSEGCWVKGVDLKYPPYAETQADDFIIGDLRDPNVCSKAVDQKFDEVYQLAADMGGAGFIFVGENDYDIMHNSAQINLNIIEECRKKEISRIFYSSSACIYPEYNQLDPDNPECTEDSAYPAAPDSEYGWEKLFSERLYLTVARNKGIEVSSGIYIAFCDDDDIWFPNKIELQLKAMKETDCKMSSTDGLIGNGIFNPTKSYKKYNAEHFYKTLQNIYINANSSLLNNGFPIIWNLDFLKIHNCIICSSVVIKKDILDKINNFKNMKPPGEDYDCWLRALEHTNSVYVKDICFYYDNGHGDGQNY